MKAAAHTPHSRLSSEATCLTEMVSVSMMKFTVSKQTSGESAPEASCELNNEKSDDQPDPDYDSNGLHPGRSTPIRLLAASRPLLPSPVCLSHRHRQDRRRHRSTFQML
jgi:hypothetical protein